MELQYLSEMKELFVKRYWSEEDVLFYLHFQNGEAIRQVEITPTSSVKLDSSNPLIGDSMLYDQTLEELDLKDSDFITEEEFNMIWNES